MGVENNNESKPNWHTVTNESSHNKPLCFTKKKKRDLFVDVCVVYNSDTKINI